jgi:pyridoxine 4-dehydrogenase
VTKVPNQIPAHIRPATPEDAGAIASVHVRAWQAAYQGLMPQDYLDRLDVGARTATWREILAAPSDVFVAEAADRTILGFIGLSPSRDGDRDPAATGELQAIYLAPEAWGRGTGRQLMATAIARLASRGFSRAALWVLETNVRARRFYEAAGWTPDGVTKQDDRHGFPISEIRYARALPPHAAQAGTWRLGDLTVNRMGFGAMRLGDDADRAIQVLRRAIDLGVNHIDTAAFYLSANELISRALKPYPDDLVIATKVWPGRHPSGEWYWASPARLRGQVEENLRVLGRDHLDVVNLRVPPSGRTGSIARHFAALAELRDEGLVRHLGISNVTPAHLAEALAIAPVVCVQNRYAVGASAAEHGFVDMCGAQGIAYTPFSAIVTSDPEPAAITEIAAAHDATPAQVRLAWTLQRGPHVLAIPGTGNPAHLTGNVAAGSLRLTGGEVEVITGTSG